ncbi:MAG: enoyl-CoA hydratase/isomerase family protein [Bacteroidota bacterium]|jgi:enoyl-CoA hydratase|nr:enoyl-CoA hydratase/isomerase family protein [Bacteroidota bacterium]MCA6441878.1 enoyl-CoA hydratase/isomerase family protein [Bacteroidota bacterium]
MVATTEFILSEVKNGVLVITINRPDKLNALNKQTIEELHDTLVEAENMNDINAVILTGAGQKAFVAGADIAEFANFSVEQGKQLSSIGHFKIFNFIENYSKPIIAAVNGFALGGGLELAMACHIRVVSDNAKMGLPEVSLGVIPGYGGTQRLAHLVGKGKAFEMIVTADMINAVDALKWGLANYVTTQDELLAKCFEITSKIATKSPTAIRTAIKVINAGYNNNLNGYEVEIEEFGKSFGTGDFKEGVAAFLEKRKPSFRGN